ncbi:MAG TPA: adenylate/guanylate cyclase domain-containing protein [Nitrososphaeraceae archaeon]|nr:adenylate/guanylate cyclase domain-containing protein [Nitrososphaeraceae archaeon]
MKQFVVIPKFKENTKEIMYFEPRIVKIVKGESITWINRDTKVHNLTSGDANSTLQSPFFQTGSMLPGESTTVKIDSNQQNIPYYCTMHPSERGVIGILPKPEDQMTDDEKARFLDDLNVSISDNANQKILTRLQRQLDPAIIEYLSDPHATLIQNRVMTIVFWDISNFSKLTEVFKDHPELIAVFLNEYLGVAVPIIHECGGIIDKFIGDGILAYFGFKEQDDDGSIGASNAIIAALRIKKAFQFFKKNWLDIWSTVTNFDTNIDIKCGINTGSVLVGLMGSQERDQFTVIGTHVNLASRMEGIAEADQIVISQYTKEKIAQKFNLETIQIKEEKIKAFEDITEYYVVTGQN